MNKLFVSSALVLAFAANASAATVATSTSTLATATTTSLTTWQGTYGAYPVFQAMTAEQQAAELRGATSTANASLPDTKIALPSYAAYAAPADYGYAVTPSLSVKQAEACLTGATPVPSFSKTWTKSAAYGSSMLGGGYLATFTLAGTAVAGSNDKLSADGYAKVNGSAFGATGNVEGKAYAQLQGTTASDNLYLKHNGTTLWSHTGSVVTAFNSTWSKTVASGSHTLWLGPVPLTLSGSASGSIGVLGNIGYASATLTAYAKPFANLSVVGAASVSLGVASGGVGGSGTFSAQIPATASMKLLSSNQVQYDVDVDAILNASGTISAWAKVNYLFGSKTWTTTVGTLGPVSGTYVIADMHGCSGVFSF